MPIPIAHPAAVLALRRFCPRYFSLSALMIGSLAPDFAYAIDDLNKFSRTILFIFGARAENLTYVKEAWDWDDFSHTLAGTVGFCLPAGFLALGVFLALRSTLVALLPNPHREALRPLSMGPKHSVLTYTVSLLAGALTHLIWDSFTNFGHSIWHDWAFLHWQLAEFASTRIDVSRACWLVSSIGGPVLLSVAYLRFLTGKHLRPWVFNQVETPYYALWALITIISLLIAIPPTLHFISFGTSASTLYNFFHRYIGFAIAAFSCTVLITGLVAKLRLSRSEKKPASS